MMTGIGRVLDEILRDLADDDVDGPWLGHAVGSDEVVIRRQVMIDVVAVLRVLVKAEANSRSDPEVDAETLARCAHGAWVAWAMDRKAAWISILNDPRRHPSGSLRSEIWYAESRPWENLSEVDATDGIDRQCFRRIAGAVASALGLGSSLRSDAVDPSPIEKLAEPATICECRCCASSAWAVPGTLPAGWGRLANVDGPSGVCPECVARNDVSDFVADGYPNARIEGGE